MLKHYRHLLALRRREITPRLAGCTGHAGRIVWRHGPALALEWRLGDGAVLCLLANLGPEARPAPLDVTRGRTIFECGPPPSDDGRLSPWSVRWSLTEAT
jgi:maltooligosyltrehalose trehalohydrolase